MNLFYAQIFKSRLASGGSIAPCYSFWIHPYGFVFLELCFSISINHVAHLSIIM